MRQADKVTNECINVRSLKSVKWSALGGLLTRALQPLLVIIVGRMVSLAEFGTFGIGIIVLGITQIFLDMGLGKILVQTEEDLNESANAIFWANVFASILLYILIYLISPWIAASFNSNDSTLMLRIICLRLILYGLTIVPLFLCQREFKFKEIFIARLSGAITSCAVILVLAYIYKLGIWSLVWGMLAGSLIQTIALWLKCVWRPKLNWNLKLLRRLLPFSCWIMFEATMSAMINWIDSIIVGYYLGLEALGIYRMGVSGINFITSIAFSPITNVALSQFSRLKNSIYELNKSYVQYTKIVFVLALPMSLCLVLYSDSLVYILLGEKWEGTEMVLTFLGAKIAFDWIVGFNPQAYIAIGRPDVNPKILLFIFVLSTPVLLIGAKHGLLWLCVARLSVGIMDCCLQLICGKKILKIKFNLLYRIVQPNLIAAIIMLLTYGFLTLIVFDGYLIIQLIIQLVICIAIYFCIINKLDHDAVVHVFRILRNSKTK